MSHVKAVEDRLKKLGLNYHFWGRLEAKELAKIILPGEVLEHCVNGSYDAGFALLAATDQRLLLVDKKPMYLSLEDIRYGTISELNYFRKMAKSALIICTPNKDLRFRSHNNDKLRKLFDYVQQRVTLSHQNLTQSPGQFQQITTQQQPLTNKDLASPSSVLFS